MFRSGVNRRVIRRIRKRGLEFLTGAIQIAGLALFASVHETVRPEIQSSISAASAVGIRTRGLIGRRRGEGGGAEGGADNSWGICVRRFVTPPTVETP